MSNIRAGGAAPGTPKGADSSAVLADFGIQEFTTRNALGISLDAPQFVAGSSIEGTPASTTSGSTAVEDSPVTPGHPLGNVNIIANGHIEADSVDGDAGSSVVRTAIVQNDDPFVASNAGGGNLNSIPRPRSDRDTSVITSENAQAVLPPNACVFVANLTVGVPDEVLQSAVQTNFEQYGECWTKIRRDTRNMPFAFVQYREVHQAEIAIIRGRGANILGRNCRTERAKVPRSLYLSRMTGGPISTEEASKILKGHGSIENCWHASPTDREMFRLPEGIWVEFAYFTDARDAQGIFRNSEQYRLETPPLPEDIKARLDAAATAQNAAAATLSAPNQQDIGQRLRLNVRGDGHRASIFIGNMAFSTSPDTMIRHFSNYGEVRLLEIISSNNNVHAFLEFMNEASAEAALAARHYLNARFLRVEPRTSTPGAVSFAVGNFDHGNDGIGSSGTPTRIGRIPMLAQPVTPGLVPADFNGFNPMAHAPAQAAPPHPMMPAPMMPTPMIAAPMMPPAPPHVYSAPMIFRGYQHLTDGTFSISDTLQPGFTMPVSAQFDDQ